MSAVQGDAPLIAVGAEVHGRDGKVGEISRVIVDAASDTVTDVVVKSGMVMPTERTIELPELAWQDGHWHVDASRDEFESLPGFDEVLYDAPPDDYAGPPGIDLESVRAANFQLNAFVAFAPAASIGRPGDYPVGEPEPEIGRWQRPSISNGTDVLDASGEKVGTVHGFVADPDSGELVQLTVRKGLVFHKDLDLPGDAVAEVSDKGVILTLDGKDVEARRRSA